jgi:hypothetical protein
MLPRRQPNGANAGVFTVNLNNNSGNDNNNNGARSLRLQLIRPASALKGAARVELKGGSLSWGLWPQINGEGDSSRHCSTVSPCPTN